MTGASLWHPLPRRIAIFRALNLGDFLCFVPALRMLRKALPEAHITLIGLPSVRDCLQRFHRYIDDFVDFPGDPSFPEQRPQRDALPGFYQAMRTRRFDLALQMHGSGAQSNTIVQALGARRWAGFVPYHSEETSWTMAWPNTQPEIVRYMLLLQYLGLPVSDDTGMEFPLDDRDHERADELVKRAQLDMSRLVFLHPGARLESRRWLPGRFAVVGKSLARDGWQIGVTGSQAERQLTKSLATAIGGSAMNLAGLTDLGMLASLLQRARLLICNDTGVSHVAAAVHGSSIVIASGSDTNRWAPLDRDRHSVLHVDMPCRPCAYEVCPLLGHPCATMIGADEVVRTARHHLAKGWANASAN